MSGRLCVLPLPPIAGAHSALGPMHNMALPTASAASLASSPRPLLYRAISETDAYIDITAGAGPAASAAGLSLAGAEQQSSPNSRTASPLHRTRAINRASAMAMQGRCSPSARSSQQAHLHSPQPATAAVSGMAAPAQVRSPALSGRFLFAPVLLPPQSQLTSAQDFAAAFGAPSATAEQEDAETEWLTLRATSRNALQQQQQFEDDGVEPRKSTPLSFLLPAPSARATAAASPMLEHNMHQQSPSPRLRYKQLDLLSSCSLDKDALLPPRENAEHPGGCNGNGKMQRNCSAPEHPTLYEEEHARQQQEEARAQIVEAVGPVASYILPPVTQGSPRRVLPSASTHASPSHMSARHSNGCHLASTTVMQMGSPAPFTPRRVEASPSLVVRQALRLTPQPFSLGSSVAVASAAVGEGGLVLPPAPRGLFVDSSGVLSEPIPFKRLSIDSAVASPAHPHPHPQSMPQRAGSLFRSSPLRDARPSRFLQQQQQQQQQYQHTQQQHHQPTSPVSTISSLYDESAESNVVASVSAPKQTTEAFVPTLPSYLCSDSSIESAPVLPSIALPFQSQLPRAVSQEEVLEEPFAPLPIEMQRQDARMGNSSNNASDGSDGTSQQREEATGGSSTLHSHSDHSSSVGHSSHSQQTHSSSFSSSSQQDHQQQQHSGHSHHSFNSSHSSTHCSGPVAISAGHGSPSAADLTSAESFFSRALSSPMWPNVLLQSLSPTLSQFLATPLGQARLLVKLRGGAVLRQHGLNLRNIMHHEFGASNDAAAATAVAEVTATAVAPVLSSRGGASLPLSALSEEIDDDGASARSLMAPTLPASVPAATDEYSAAIGSPAASAVSYRFIWLRGEGAGMEVCWARLRDRAFAGVGVPALAPMLTPMGSFPVSWLSGVCTGADSPTFSFCRVHALAGGSNAHSTAGGVGTDALTSDARCCFSLLLNTGDSLDLECSSQEETDSWMRAFVFLHRYALKEEHFAAQRVGATDRCVFSAAGRDELAHGSAAAVLSCPLPPAPALSAAPYMPVLTSSAVSYTGTGDSRTNVDHSHSHGSQSYGSTTHSRHSHHSNSSCRSESAAMALSQLAAVESNGAKPATQASATAAVSASPSTSVATVTASLPAAPLLLPASSSLGARMCTSSTAIGVTRASSAYRQQTQPQLQRITEYLAASHGRVATVAPTTASSSSSSAAAHQTQTGSQFSDDEFALLCAAVMLQMGPDGSDNGSLSAEAAASSSGLAFDGEDCSASFRALDSSSQLDADSILLAELVNPAAWSTPLAAANARHSHAHRQACISIVYRLTAAQRTLGLYQRDHARLSSRLSSELEQKRRQLAQLQQQSAVYRALLEQSKAVNAEWHRRMPEVATSAAASVVLPQAQQRAWITSAPAICSSHSAATLSEQADSSIDERQGSSLSELAPSLAPAPPSNLAVLFPPLRASQLQVSVSSPASVAASAAAAGARAPTHLHPHPHHPHLLPTQPSSSLSSMDSSGSLSSASDASARRLLLPMLSDSSASSGGASSSSGGGSARSSGTLRHRTLVSMSSDGTPTAFRHSSRHNGGTDSARSNSTAPSEQDPIVRSSNRSIPSEAREPDRGLGGSSDGSHGGSEDHGHDSCDGDRSSSDSTSSRRRSSSPPSRVLDDMPMSSAVPSKHLSPAPALAASGFAPELPPVPFGSFVLPPAQSLLEIPRGLTRAGDEL